MDAATLSDLTQMGFGIAAQNIGYAFDHYRPSGASNPLAASNLQGQLNAHFSIDPALKRFSTYDNPLFTALVDGRVCQAGDYLDHATQGTWFIATLSTSPGMPNMSVQCGRTVTISRPTSATALSALMTAWPASIVRKGSRGTDEANLPGNIPNPQWEMLLPSVVGVGLDVSDVVTDDLLRLYFVEQAELSGYGWRCTIKQVPPINGATIYHYAQVVEATGKPITFRKVTSSGGPNPVLTTEDYPCKAIIGSYETHLIDGATVKVGDVRVLMQPTASDGRAIPKPTPTDKLIIDGVTRSIGVVNAQYAGASVALWEIQARG